MSYNQYWKKTNNARYQLHKTQNDRKQ